MPHPLLKSTLLILAGGSLLTGVLLAQENRETAAPDAQSSTEQTPKAEPPKWVQVERRALGSNTTVGGTVIPLEEITFTAQMPGNVDLIAGSEGDFFRKGAVLAELDAAALRAQRQAALAAITNAQAAYRNAEVQYQREREDPSPRQGGNMMSQMMPMPFFGGDKETGVARSATLHQYGTQIEQAQGALVAAQAQLREIDAKLEDTKSIAPFDGYITHKHVNAGDTVQPGQPLLGFANMDRLQLQADVPTRLSAPLQPGFVTRVRLDDPAQTVVAARVAQVFPMADPTRHTVRVKLDLQENAPAKAGMYAEMLIPQPDVGQGSAPVIPVAALVYRGGLPMVYVLDDQDRPRLHLLRLGEQYGDTVTVLTGLRGGERILIEPAEVKPN
ncbi:efflux RND transporter periplasmic adaptor subunit [Imhoffiella purpurea]|uniref:Efflux transporter, RND family, MFP subunit n=1 Tax=Imhoffiella purpurea TaxID=1249627 RepID=W9VAM7_9GAMM|nr:efflux RND transporter periplasmic adaptor subunit [Imhoffiella purpurea]EXJ13961.1 efflux transporter, RND family, MFP subunit [Imhoffiella purpurea]